MNYVIKSSPGYYLSSVRGHTAWCSDTTNAIRFTAADHAHAIMEAYSNLLHGAALNAEHVITLSIEPIEPQPQGD